MITPDQGDPQANQRPRATTDDVTTHGRLTFWLILVATLALAMVVGAYVDWLWWPVYAGLVLTIIALAILVASAIVAALGSGRVRRVGLVGLGVAAGLLIGQNLGPTREPLVYTDGGTMTLRLTSPVIVATTGPADCTNVASETEFQVTGTPDLRLPDMNRAWDLVSLTVGDRWDAIEDGPDKDGVRLSIWGTDLAIAADGKPSQVAMEAVESSTLEATFTNEGGSARFAKLAPRARSDLLAAPWDLAGTIEWTCGPVVEDSDRSG